MTQESTSPAQRILQALQQANRRLEIVTARVHEPIAVVGMACRFPGANTPEEYWALLEAGRDMMSEIPASRWDVNAYYDPVPGTPGKMYVRQGAFVENVDQFDARFFGIAPREAVSLDPQQRFLLEVAWEALERAAIAPQSLKESRTGVYVGMTWNDYARFESDADRISTYTANGTGFCFASGRLSYVLGLQGPNLVLDTGCSGSIVTVHLACQSLRSGEIDLALAGGVNLMLTPETTIGSCLMTALAADGRCKTFDASADGYNRGEGCGIVVLKRLSDAQKAGDPILAVIRGSAVNHDGPSSGLTVPNRAAQSRVIRSALENSRIAPQDIAYVEAHGTGTALGDPIEIRGLAGVYDVPQRSHPLLIGSVKTNFGHLESAAGIASFIKVVLALQNNSIPPQLHFKNPSPHIDWEKVPIRVVTQSTPWPGEKRLAGVSSFGIGGTNAHIILEAAPSPATGSEAFSDASDSGKGVWQVLPLTSKSEAALQGLARRYEAYLDKRSLEQTAELANICYTAAIGRNHFAHRLALVGEYAAEIQSQLRAFADSGGDKQTPGVFFGYAPEHRFPPTVAFLFTGQGAQYVGMGSQLYETEPVFRQIIDQCDEMLKPHVGESLRALLYPSQTDSHSDNESTRILDQTGWTQPALFVLEYALATLWRSWGIEPAVLIGHSVGEIAAACIAGVMSLEDGLALVAARGRLMQNLPKDGTMMSLMASEASVEKAITPHAHEVSIAALNGPGNIVISGRKTAIMRIAEALKAEGVRSRELSVSHAFHSPLMEPMMEEFARAIKAITFSPPRIPMISNLTGQIVGKEMASADYWVRHVREPVRFAQSVQTAVGLGVGALLEIGPKPTLLGLTEQSLEGTVRESLLLCPSLRAGQPDRREMLSSLARLYVQGVPVRWEQVGNTSSCRRLVLPTYPFQRQRYWVDKAPTARRRDELRPLVHRMQRSPLVKETIFETVFRSDSPPYLSDHRVLGKIVVPGACHLAMVLSAYELAYGRDCHIEEVMFSSPLLIPEADEAESERIVQLVFTPVSLETSASGGRQQRFQLVSLAGNHADSGDHAVHAMGYVESTGMGDSKKPSSLGLDALRAEMSEEIPLDELYGKASSAHIIFGPSFQWVNSIFCRGGEALGRLSRPKAVGSTSGYVLHPGLLDACFQVAGLSMTRGRTDAKSAYVAVGVGGLRVHPPLSHGDHTRSDEWWCHVRPSGEAEESSRQLRCDIYLLDNEGQCLVEVLGFEIRRMSQAALSGNLSHEDWLYALKWQQKPLYGLANSSIRAPIEIHAQMQGDIEAWHKDRNFVRYLAALGKLRGLCVDYVLAMFRQLGLNLQPGTHATLEQVTERLRVVPRHRRLLRRMLQMLAEQGMLSVHSGLAGAETWQVVQALPQPSVDEAEAKIRGDYGDLLSAELAMMAQCRDGLADVLQGARDPLDLLFPGGDATVATRLYRESYGATLMGAMVRKVVMAAIASIPAEQGIRILEVGAGTGGTTVYLLPHLPAERTRYWFTDIGAAFLKRAQEDFSSYGFLRYKTLDIEQAPITQGFELNETDIVVAADVLHATKDLRKTLAHVRALLAPGGVLLMLAGTARTPFVDLTFGLTEGWWLFDDDIRTDYPLLTVDQWRRLLLESGFSEVSFIPDDSGLADRLDRAVIVARADQHVSNTAQSWLLFSGDAQDGMGDCLAAQLQQRGHRTTHARMGDHYKQRDSSDYNICPDQPEQYIRLLKEAGPFDHIVHLWGLNPRDRDARDTTTGDIIQDSQRGCGTVLPLVQALRQQSSRPSALWLLTQGARAVDSSEDVPGVGQSTLWGMGVSVAQEHPEFHTACMDLDPVMPLDQQAQMLCAGLCAHEPRENRVALRRGARFVERLLPLDKTSAGKSSGRPNIRGDARYLITGGTGGLGLQLARWLVDQGARHLTLVGRRKPSSEAQAHIGALVQMGAEIQCVHVDISDPAQVAEMLRAETSEYPLRGVFHLAGILDDGIVEHQNWQRFSQVFAPKVQGAWNLHIQTAGLPLDYFVLYSSAVSILGNAGQTSYAAANAFLDSLAHYRRTRGLVATAINWGAWAEAGMAAEMIGRNREQLAREGIGVIEPAEGLGVLQALLVRGVGQAAVLPMDWGKFAKQFEGGLPLLSELVGRESVVSDLIGEAEAAFHNRLKQASREERHTLVETHIHELVARVLGLRDRERVDAREGLMSRGMDSLMAVELRNRLASSFGQAMPSTLLFDYPTVEALVGYVEHTVFAGDTVAEPTAEAPAPDEDLDAIKNLSETDLLAFIGNRFKELSS